MFATIEEAVVDIDQGDTDALVVRARQDQEALRAKKRGGNVVGVNPRHVDVSPCLLKGEPANKIPEPMSDSTTTPNPYHSRLVIRLKDALPYLKPNGRRSSWLVVFPPRQKYARPRHRLDTLRIGERITYFSHGKFLYV